MKAFVVSSAHCVLASVLAVMSIGCDDGTTNPGPAGSGGGAGTGETNDLIFGAFEPETGQAVDSGYWVDEGTGIEAAFFTYNDMTAGALQTPVAMMTFTGETPDIAERGMFAGHTYGSGFMTWGAGMGVNVRVPAGAGSPLMEAQKCVPAAAYPTAPCTFDASAYTGVGFWARLSPGTVHAVRMKVVDAQVAKAENGGVCADAGGLKCDNAFGHIVDITNTEWNYFSYTWEELTQETWADGIVFTAIDRTKILGLQFQVGKGANFDFWVDNVAFTVAD